VPGAQPNIEITYCCYIITAFFITALLLRVPQIANFGILGCRQIFFSPKGCREPQNVEKH